MPTSLDALARPQAGIVARRQLLAAGWSPSAVRRALAAGRLVGVGRGVYRMCGVPWSRRAAQHAAILLAGDGAALCRWSAAELHRFAEPHGGPFDVCTPHTRRRPVGADSLLRLTRTRTLAAGERVEVDGLPATSAPRTLLDLAGTASTARLTELVATAVRLRACSLSQVQQAFEAHPSASGHARLASALELLAGDGGTARSEVEIAALRAIVGAGLPRPVVAHRVHDDQGRLIAEVDLAYPDRRIAIEVDGFAWHSSPERKRRDERRQNALVLAGWTVLRFSATDVRRRPGRLVVAVRSALAAD